MASSKRILKELSECNDNLPKDITIKVSDDNIYKWEVTFTGPPGTIYEGGTWTVTVTLPADYPFKTPIVNFNTRIYHPNVTNDEKGAICVSVLKPENWKPASRIRTVLEHVKQLLVKPNPDDPLENRIADQYRHNRQDFDKTAKYYVDRYAMPKK